MSGDRTADVARLAEAIPWRYVSNPAISSAVAVALLPVVDAIADERAREAERRGYERGRRDLAEYLSRVYNEARAAALRGAP